MIIFISRICATYCTLSIVAYKTGYTYDTDNRITEMDFGGDDKIRYTYDSLGRVSARTVENGTDAGKLETAYSFAAGGYGEGSTTPLVESIRQPGVSFDYAYDNRGNIISEGTVKSYAQNQQRHL